MPKQRNNDDEDEREAEAGNKQGFKAISFSKNTDNKLKQKKKKQYNLVVEESNNHT